MKVAVVFEPDPDLGFDPLDDAKLTRRQGLFIDSDKTDVLLVYRLFDERFEGGMQTEVVGSGIWEHVKPAQLDSALERLAELE